MKSVLSLIITFASLSVFATDIQLACSFKEDGNAKSLNLIGSQDASGAFNLRGKVSDINVEFNYSRTRGRDMSVSYGGTTYQVSKSGSGKMSYPMGGLGGLVLGAMGGNDSDRDIKIKCDPSDIKLAQSPLKTVAKPIVKPTVATSSTASPSIEKNNSNVLVLLQPIDGVAAKVNKYQNGQVVLSPDYHKPLCKISTKGLPSILTGKLTVLSESKTFNSYSASFTNEDGQKFSVACVDIYNTNTDQLNLEGMLDHLGVDLIARGGTNQDEIEVAQTVEEIDDSGREINEDVSSESESQSSYGSQGAQM